MKSAKNLFWILPAILLIFLVAGCPSGEETATTEEGGTTISTAVPIQPPPGLTNDADGDGIAYDSDNCPEVANAQQEDEDGDVIGDACDNCPAVANADQKDADNDHLGDACDNCKNKAGVNQTDTDGDGLGNICDNCPNKPNADQLDPDNDKIGTECDNCPNKSNPDQKDTDNNGVGDVCEPATGVTAIQKPLQAFLHPAGTAPLPEWIQVSAAGAHTCAIAGDGTAWCWGDNEVGQLGNGTFDSQHMPVKVKVEDGAEAKWKKIAAGGNHTCAIRNDDKVLCWGSNVFGQLGSGESIDTVTRKNIPTLLKTEGDVKWSSVSSGGMHTCAIKNNGELWCWGFNQHGQLGNNELGSDQIKANAFKNEPVRIGLNNDWVAVSAGGLHTCGLRDATGSFSLSNKRDLYCWGLNDYGQLGIGVMPAFPPGTDNKLDEPFKVGDDNRWHAISAGVSHTCAIKITGFSKAHSLYCWGKSDKGQLGIGDAAEITNQPVKVGRDDDWESVALGMEHTCGLESGSLYCWGDDSNGQVGDGAVTGGSKEPKRIMEGTGWSLVSAGSEHACGMTRDNQLFCWGKNSSGQIGNGKTENQPEPVRLVRKTLKEPNVGKDKILFDRNLLPH